MLGRSGRSFGIWVATYPATFEAKLSRIGVVCLWGARKKSVYCGLYFYYYIYPLNICTLVIYKIKSRYLRLPNSEVEQPPPGGCATNFAHRATDHASDRSRPSGCVHRRATGFLEYLKYLIYKIYYCCNRNTSLAAQHERKKKQVISASKRREELVENFAKSASACAQNHGLVVRRLFYFSHDRSSRGCKQRARQRLSFDLCERLQHKKNGRRG